MKPIPTMDIDTALSQMSRERAIDLMWRRMFCNADETISTIAEHDIRKQIPKKPTALRYGSCGNFLIVCTACGNSEIVNPVLNDVHGYKFCPNCGQRIDWSETE